MAQPEPHASSFARRWSRLTHPHVRALAWLLDAPDLLDSVSPHWQAASGDSLIATLGQPAPDVVAWLHALERDPAPLDAALGGKIHTRLGLYAEKLMAFYFQSQGRLVAHSLQVRARHDNTVGEFDFLLDAGAGLDHIELATKFYLLAGDPARGFRQPGRAELADSLGAKMRKIIAKQLALGAHPAAQALLPRPVRRAQALVKGWLFYPLGQGVQTMDGIAADHCRGFWCALDELDKLAGKRFVLLPKLQWLAPYRTQSLEALALAGLRAALNDHFALHAMPVLIASVQREADLLVEMERGFIVPDNWRAHAAARRA